MNILVAGAVGRGPTPPAAFDAALVAAGVADRNLIYLSSVLPPASAVRQVDRIGRTPGSWGDRLGWAQDGCGRGLLVEHEASDEASLRRLVTTSLDALCRNRGARFPCRGIEVAGARCTAQPVCALVVAVFQSVAWDPDRRPVRAAAPV